MFEDDEFQPKPKISYQTLVTNSRVKMQINKRQDQKTMFPGSIKIISTFIVILSIICIEGLAFALAVTRNYETHKCCPCDEAKYELVFEGLWSKYTHPDEYPDPDRSSPAWFGDIIGASHSDDFRMWDEDMLATEGVKELAETGSTKKLESELKYASSKTRTIIKARELKYSTLNSRTSAVFRTDKFHHLVSILTKLGPSPDWMVGVSALDLCSSDCSWSNQKTVLLYPFDAGTDSAMDFDAPDQPTNPQEMIKSVQLSRVINRSNQIKQQEQQQLGSLGLQNESRWIPFQGSQNDYSSYSMSNPMYPNDSSNLTQKPESAQSDQSKPFARLTITRQRIYEKSCGASDLNSGSSIPTRTTSSPSSSRAQNNFDIYGNSIKPNRSIDLSDCRVTEWSDWSSCSTACGKGIRTRARSFKSEQALVSGCSEIDLNEKEICLAQCIGNVTCYTRDWSEWSKCSVDCGQGKRTRTRVPIGPRHRLCESIDLADEEPCTGHLGSDCSEQEKLDCRVTDWSAWSDCGNPCGKY